MARAKGERDESATFSPMMCRFWIEYQDEGSSGSIFFFAAKLSKNLRLLFGVNQ